ncbi:branched-chain amino acid ABC transporter permease [Rhizobium sp. Root1204]|uniref:branched-chain amino acid ABC transporter permease n=1 Tax=Rhizobium sp. Root1204 TaxID=1736428 RepID=UPI000715B643|nr:branched-chain amino acid ABC transporter permease [Rhizobium sp. Root1204]KQV41331.1 urea ABC transporter [Rhizobium sp. Root1204]
MDDIALQAFNILVGISTLALITIGLGVVYGMMKIINLAHGEFMMLGAYTVVVATSQGINTWLALFVLAPLVSGAAGVVVERLLIRFLYGRMIDTMLATWGLGLVMTGVMTTIFGNQVRGVATPIGSLSIGRFDVGLFGLVIFGAASASLATIFMVLKFTRIGLIVRATMQNSAMASALGVPPKVVYMGTFALGTALAGLAGGVLAPVSGVSPSMGAAYIAKAFITVLGGGPAIVSGTALASAVFGPINEIVSFHTTPIIGEVALLLSAIVLVRILPQGITGRFLRRSL